MRRVCLFRRTVSKCTTHFRIVFVQKPNTPHSQYRIIIIIYKHTRSRLIDDDDDDSRGIFFWGGGTIYRDLINCFLFEPAAAKAAAATAHTGSVSIVFPRQPSPDQLVRIRNTVGRLGRLGRLGIGSARPSAG